MFSVCVRDHVMIAHSFVGEAFGPAQRLHGATYVVDLEFGGPELDPSGVLVDIGRAATMLRGIAEWLNYRNLDEVTEFSGANTTTEYLAKAIYDRALRQITGGALGSPAPKLTSLRVVLHESHVAWAAYEGPARVAAASK